MSLAFLQLFSSSQELFLSVQPSHLIKNLNLFCQRCESRISSTMYSGSPSMSIGGCGVICWPGMMGGLYGHKRETLIGASILNDGGNFSSTALGEII